LSGLMRQTNRDVKCLNVEDAASLGATLSLPLLSGMN
jgi:hypothetical protein